MTLFFPDLNVWLALSDAGHIHSASAWQWMAALPPGRRLLFARYTQIGLLRLLTNAAVMGKSALTLRQAWGVYDRWLADPGVELYPEPHSLDADFRRATEPFAARPAATLVGDCYLLAYAHGLRATLATFDRGLLQSARKLGYAAVMPA